MERDEYDDLLRRLTALIVKLDARDDHFIARLAHQDAILEELREFTREQREFNRQQVSINTDLKNLLERAWRSSTNGHTD